MTLGAWCGGLALVGVVAAAGPGRVADASASSVGDNTTSSTRDAAGSSAGDGPAPTTGDLGASTAGVVSASSAGAAELDRLVQQLRRTAAVEAGLRRARVLHERFPKNYDLAWRLARAAFFAANGSADEERKCDIGWEGYEAGLAALELDPDGAEAYFWGGCALGLYAEEANILTVVATGLAGKVERLLREAVRRDRYQSWGGPLEALGRYYFQAPWPLKDLEESLRLLNSAVRIAPERIRTRSYLADSYLDNDQPELAERHYRICADGDPSRLENPDAARWQRHCREQLAELVE